VYHVKLDGIHGEDHSINGCKEQVPSYAPISIYVNSLVILSIRKVHTCYLTNGVAGGGWVWMMFWGKEKSKREKS
jgi:hypothetical protein